MLSIIFLVFWELLDPSVGAAYLLPGGPFDKGPFWPHGPSLWAMEVSGGWGQVVLLLTAPLLIV